MTLVNFNTDKSGGSGQEGFTLLPLGRYDYKVESAQVKESSNNNPLMTVVLAVQHKDYPMNKVWANFTFSGKALHFANMFLKALGSEYYNKTEVDLDDMAKEIVEKRCSAYTEEKVYKGKPNNVVSKFTPAENDGLDSKFSISEEESKKSIYE